MSMARARESGGEWLRMCFVRLKRGWQCTIETDNGKKVSRCQTQHRKREVGERCMKRLLDRTLKDGTGE